MRTRLKLLAATLQTAEHFEVGRHCRRFEPAVCPPRKWGRGTKQYFGGFENVNTTVRRHRRYASLLRCHVDIFTRTDCLYLFIYLVRDELPPAISPADTKVLTQGGIDEEGDKSGGDGSTGRRETRDPGARTEAGSARRAERRTTTVSNTIQIRISAVKGKSKHSENPPSQTRRSHRNGFVFYLGCYSSKVKTH